MMMAKIVIPVATMTMTAKNETKKSSRSRHLLVASDQEGIVDNDKEDDKNDD